MITIKNESQIEKMRNAGALLHEVLEALRREIEPGVTTYHLDQMAERLIRAGGGIPSSKGYNGFPASICASVDLRASLSGPLYRVLINNTITCLLSCPVSCVAKKQDHCRFWRPALWFCYRIY